LKRVFCLLIAVLLFLPSISFAEDAATLDEAFDKVFKRYKTTGGVIVVAREGEIVYQRNYGYAYARDKEEVTDDTYFRIASVSKLVSAMHVMQLVEDGLLDLDTDISEYFGYTIRNFRYKDVPITLRQLMSHTSSINSEGGYTYNQEATVQEMLSLESRRGSNYLKFAPGTEYVYSNFGAGLMGSLIELATGKNLNDSITERLFAPLNIDASYAPTLLNDPEKVTYLYSEEGKVVKGRSKILSDPWDESVNPELHFRSVPGRIWIKGRDLCRLGMVLCQGGTLDGQVLLQPETIAAMQEDQKGKPGISCDSRYGLCVYRESLLLEDRLVYGHQGMSNGLVAGLFYEPQSQFVVAIITNGSDSRQDHRLTIINRKLFALAWEHFGENAGQ